KWKSLPGLYFFQHAICVSHTQCYSCEPIKRYRGRPGTWRDVSSLCFCPLPARPSLYWVTCWLRRRTRHAQLAISRECFRPQTIFGWWCPVNVPQAAFESYAQLFKGTLMAKESLRGQASAI